MPFSLSVSTRLREVGVALCLMVTFAACAGGGGGDTPSTAPLPGGQTGGAISIAIAPSTATIVVGATQSLAAAVSGTTNTAVNWSTSASSVAAVSSSGVVTGVAPGTATITAAAVADPSRIATATINVTAPLVLRVPVDTVRPGMVLRAVVTGVVLPTTMPATLGSTAVTLARESDTTLVGFVPEMVSGTTALSVTIGSRSGQVAVQVRPGLVIADPTLEITRLADRVKQRYSATAVPAGYTSAEWTRSRAVADSLDRELRSALAAAPAAERLAVARMLAAYPPTTSALAALFLTPDRCGGAADRLVARGVNVIGNLLGVRASEVLTTKLHNISSLTNHLDGVLDYVVGMGTFPVECAITEILENDAPASATVDHGGTLGVAVTAVVRSLDGSRSQDPQIRGVTQVTDDIIAKFRSLAPSTQSAVSKLPTRIQELPAQAPTRTALDPQYVALANVTPNSVTITPRADGNRVALVATTTATEPTAFTAVLSHKNHTTVTTTVRGTVRPASNIVVSVSPSTLTIVGVQTERSVSATVTGTTNMALRWRSNDSTIVTIVGTPTGGSATLRARNRGSTTVRAISVQDSTKYADISVTVTSGIGITVNPTSVTLPVGGTQFVAVSLTGVPSGQSTSMSWTNSNPAVATVTNGNGGLNVTGAFSGTSTITIRSVADPTVGATIPITVTPAGSGGTATRLTSGVAVSGLSGAAGSSRLFVITVPTGATGLTVRTTGGSGDADLFVRRGSAPTPTAADCESVESSTVESCTFTNPTAGEWYILLVGYEAYSGVTLTATVTGGSGGGGTGGGDPPTGSTCQAQWGSVLQGTWRATSYVIIASQYIPGILTSVIYDFGVTTFRWTFNYPSGSPKIINTTYTVQTNAAANLVGGNRCAIVAPASDGTSIVFKIQGYAGGVLELRDDGDPFVPVFVKIVKQ